MHRVRKDSRKSRRIYAEIDTAASRSHRVISQSRKQPSEESLEYESLKSELLKIHHRRYKQRRQDRRRRSKRVGNGTNESLLPSNMKDASYTKNYLKLSADFVASSKYHVNSRRRKYPACVKCMTKRSKLVMFPCEHLCLCNGCLDRDGIPKQCPLCNSSVHVVLEHTDNVISRYWLWVDEEKSSITESFSRGFRLKSSAAINAAAAIAAQQQQARQTKNVERHVENVFQERQSQSRSRSSWVRHFLCPRDSFPYVWARSARARTL